MQSIANVSVLSDMSVVRPMLIVFVFLGPVVSNNTPQLFALAERPLRIIWHTRTNTVCIKRLTGLFLTVLPFCKSFALAFSWPSPCNNLCTYSYCTYGMGRPWARAHAALTVGAITLPPLGVAPFSLGAIIGLAVPPSCHMNFLFECVVVSHVSCRASPCRHLAASLFPNSLRRRTFVFIGCWRLLPPS